MKFGFSFSTLKNSCFFLLPRITIKFKWPMNLLGSYCNNSPWRYWCFCFKRSEGFWLAFHGYVGFESFYGSQWLRARLCCRKISDSIFWLFCFTPRWRGWRCNALPKEGPWEICKERIETDKRRKTFLSYFPLFTWWMD